MVASAALALGCAVAWWCWSRGYTLYYGDAEAHLNIARRIFDSRTPGPEQIGTVWLPLPHVLIAPFAIVDSWWRSGIAGVIPSVAAFATACGFLYAAALRAFGSRAAGFAAAGVFALNPNMLYLASTPMTEPLAAAALAALLWATLWFRDSQSVLAILIAAAASNASSLTRYEGWFLIPFVAVYLLAISKNKWHAVLFAALAALGPLAWLAHNQFYYSNVFEFYDGPYSAKAIYERQLGRGMEPHPGNQDWIAAGRYYFAAIRYVIGWPTIMLGLTGAALALWRRVWWPLALLALPGIFYVWSIHAGGTPVFVPELEPFTRYNTRYALAMLPLAAMGAGGLVAALPRWRGPASAIILAAIGTVWVAGSGPLSLCWQEAARASESRRAWTDQAAAFLSENYQPGEGLLYTFGDLTGVLREAGIPLRESLYQDNGLAWNAAVRRPGLFQFTVWALALEGDEVANGMVRPDSGFQLRRRIEVKGAPVVQIYHRQ